MGMAGEDNINAAYGFGDFLVNVKPVMRQQHHNFSAIITGFINVFLNFFRTNTKRPCRDHIAWIGDWRVREMLTNNSNLDPAPFKIFGAFKNTFIPFGVKDIAAQKWIGHFFDDFFNAVLTKSKLPMPNHGIRLQQGHGIDHILTIGF